MISVRASVTLLCLVLIVGTAVVTLSVTVSFALDAAQSIASAHAVSLGAKARDNIQDFLNQPISTLIGWQYMLRRDHFPLPIVYETIENQPNWFRWWWQQFVIMMAAGGFRYQFAVSGFDDGNYAGCKLLSTEQFQCRMFDASNKSMNNGVSRVYQETYYISNYSLVAAANTTITYDPRTRSWYHTVNSSVKDDMAWSSVYLSAVPTLPVVDIDSAIFNGTGTFLGVLSLTFELDELSSFLTSLEATPNTKAVLLDNDDLLMASTIDDMPYLTQTTIPSNFSGPVPSNCVTSDVANGATSSLLLCRQSVSTYPWSALRGLAAEHPSFLANGAEGAQRLKIAGETYYVVVLAISTPRARGMGWRFVLLMPENDIIGQIVAGRNAAIIITAVLLVVAFLAAFSVVTIILRPLRNVADMMYLTATLQIEDEPNGQPKSAFAEIYTIEKAFHMLTAELAKIKSYLPPSIMAALYGDDDDEDACDDGEDDKQLGDIAKVESVATVGEEELTQKKPSKPFAVKVNNNNSRNGSTALPLAQKHSTLSRLSSNHDAAKDALAIPVPGIPVQLNVALKLTQKKVTVLCISLRDLCVFSKGTPDEILQNHGHALAAVQRVLKDHKGVVDTFQGDDFIATFNAVTSVGNHACAAANVALALQDVPAMSNGVIKGTFRCGFASGQSLVGNMGNQQMKRCCVTGAVAVHAQALMKLTSKYTGANILTAGSAIADTENFFEQQLLDIIPVPMKDGVKRVQVAAIKKPKSVASDEWMYQLQEGSAGSAYSKHNNAFQLFLQGKNMEASKLLEEAVHTKVAEEPEHERLHRVEHSKRLKQLADSGLDGTSYTHAMDDFYHVSCLETEVLPAAVHG